MLTQMETESAALDREFNENRSRNGAAKLRAQQRVAQAEKQKNATAVAVASAYADEPNDFSGSHASVTSQHPRTR